MTEETTATTTTSSVQAVREIQAAEASVPAIDWESGPVYREAVYEETVVTEVHPARVPRGRWDFTNAQRIILAILLWLNIMVLVLGVLLITGRLAL